jgi:hypothetical protein
MDSGQQADNRLADEIHSFKSLWRGGYYEGDPLDPLGPSGYLSQGYMSVLHATYLACIRPYVTAQTIALEIGPGRGAWTKSMLAAKEIWCLDALSAEHNQFWEYIGKQPHVHYHQVSDFSCSVLPDDHFDFFFTFGVFCHVSFDGISAYMQNLRNKLRPGANGFMMVADYDKFNASMRQMDRLSASRVTEIRRRLRVLRTLWRTMGGDVAQPLKDKSEDLAHYPGRWYHAGIDRTCSMLEQLGYTVVSPDIGVNFRDPVIQFRR